MEIAILHLNAHSIYSWMAPRSEEGKYCYYTQPWKKKIFFDLPFTAAEAYKTGNLKSLVLVHLEGDEYLYRSMERYRSIIPHAVLYRDKYNRLHPYSKKQKHES